MPFIVIKSALFVQANVAVNTKLEISMFLKKFGQKRAIQVWYDEKIFLLPPPPQAAPRRQHFRKIFFRCPFQYPKVHVPGSR